MKTDTIASIATGLSDSGIGIIRISGKQTFEICNHIFVAGNGQHNLLTYKSHTIHYGFIINNNEKVDANWKNNIIDEVMITIMKAPKSYTTEDTVEINCHGGVLVVKKILALVLKNGARLAEPGEFTKRAFLNGRIDLSKAEAVMDIINSKNEMALESSMNQLKGSVSDKIKYFRDEIIYEIAYIESALDDPEHISLDGYSERLEKINNKLILEIDSLISTANNGKIIKEGIKTVIIGKPNSGKSSLLNLLLGEERAIVTDIAGTTRDILEESIVINGIHLNIIDTAGIRFTEDTVEKIGVKKAKEYAEKADLIIYMVDSSVELDQNDIDIIEFIMDKKVIFLLNKLDLEIVVNENNLLELIKNERKYKDGEFNIIKTSTQENIGINILENKIEEMFIQGKIKVNEELIITNIRHKEALVETLESLYMVKKSLEDNMPEDFYSIDLMSAYSSLGKIIGEEVGEDLVNEIFSKFCMGK